MSRIGKNPVDLPKGITITADKNLLRVKGPKGELTQAFKPEVTFDIGDKSVQVNRTNDTKRARSMHGLYRNLLQNMITGVTVGNKKILIINGVGFRAEQKGKNVVFNLGYSTNIEYVVPEGAIVTCETNTKVLVEGIDKVLVGKVASEIRGLRPPEPYKGKGIKYEDERIRRKVGKSGVK